MGFGSAQVSHSGETCAVAATALEYSPAFSRPRSFVGRKHGDRRRTVAPGQNKPWMGLLPEDLAMKRPARAPNANCRQASRDG